MTSITVQTVKPIAYDSPDHICPHGTAQDNSTNVRFNRKLFRICPAHSARVLDLGCSGGGFVKSILDAGGFAIGIEGSDYSQKRKRAEWGTIPGNLHTADITTPFHIMVDGKPATFNIITAWEVIEHIANNDLGVVARNMDEHLAPKGVVMMSVSPNEEVVKGVRLHQTVKGKEWWISRWRELGFVHHERIVTYFGDDWIRWHENAPNSFHLVLSRLDERLHIDETVGRYMLIAVIGNRVRRGRRWSLRSFHRAIGALKRLSRGR